MKGPEFHEFLIRGSNDRLLTDRHTGGFIDVRAFFVDHVNEHYRRRKAAQAIDDERAWNEFRHWLDVVDHGARRAPLELIAYVVENDLPYTEILTADYVMANPFAAKAYGASTYFRDSEDEHEFRPSRIAKYYREGEGFILEESDDVMAIPRHRSRPPAHDLPARRYPQHLVVPAALPDDGDQPQPGAGALDLLPLPRPRHRKVGGAHHRPGGAGGHPQPDHAEPGVHGVPQRHGPGGGGVPELRRRGTIQIPVGRGGLAGRSLQV